MSRVETIDLLFQSVLARFFSIPARRPASGAVTFAQMRVLWVIEMEGASPQGDVARRLGVSNSTMTEVVDRLVRGGYVRREESSRDRRRVVLNLRPRGRSMLADYAKRRRERFEKLASVVGKGDIDRIARALETLNEVLAKWNGRAP